MKYVTFAIMRPINFNKRSSILLDLKNLNCKMTNHSNKSILLSIFYPLYSYEPRQVRLATMMFVLQ